MKTTLVTNTSKGAIRLGDVVIHVGKSEHVDRGALKHLRRTGAAPGEQAHGVSLVDGVPEIVSVDNSKIVADAKAEAVTILDDAKAEAAKILDDARAEAAGILDDATKPASPPKPPGK